MMEKKSGVLSIGGYSLMLSEQTETEAYDKWGWVVAFDFLPYIGEKKSIRTKIWALF